MVLQNLFLKIKTSRHIRWFSPVPVEGYIYLLEQNGSDTVTNEKNTSKFTTSLGMFSIDDLIDPKCDNFLDCRKGYKF